MSQLESAQPQRDRGEERRPDCGKDASLSRSQEMLRSLPQSGGPGFELLQESGFPDGVIRNSDQSRRPVAETATSAALDYVPLRAGRHAATGSDTEFCVRSELTAAEGEEWESFYAQCKHSHVNQHLSFSGVEAGKGKRILYLMARKRGRLVCAGLFSIRPLLGWRCGSLEAACFRGPVFDEVGSFREFALRAMDFCRQNFIGSIRIAPHWFFPEAEALEGELRNLGFVPSQWGGSTREPTGLVDVQRSDEELLGSFSKSARREIYRAERQGVRVRAPAGKKEAEQYFTALNAMLYRRRCITMRWGECMSIYEDVLKAENVGILLTAWKNLTFLGGLLVVRSPNMAHGYRFVVVPTALSELSNLRIAPLVWHRAMCWARSRGCRWLDLEGYLPIMDKTHPLYSIYKYKGEFNPSPIDRIAPHTCPGHPIMYGLYRAERFVTGRVARVPRYLWARIKIRFSQRQRAPVPQA